MIPDIYLRQKNLYLIFRSLILRSNRILPLLLLMVSPTLLILFSTSSLSTLTQYFTYHSLSVLSNSLQNCCKVSYRLCPYLNPTK